MPKEAATIVLRRQVAAMRAQETIGAAVTAFPERTLAMTRVVGSFARAVMMAGILGTLAAPWAMAGASPNQFAQATPVPAQPAPTAPPQPGQTAPAQTAPGSHRMHRAAVRTRAQLVEVMISNMRTQLRITPAEQSQFDAVADVMRTNAKVMEILLDERAHDTDQSAVASLQWYEKLTDAHAAALKNFTPAFETLYATLSAGQRKAADAMFLRLAERPFTPKSR